MKIYEQREGIVVRRCTRQKPLLFLFTQAHGKIPLVAGSEVVWSSLQVGAHLEVILSPRKKIFPSSYSKLSSFHATSIDGLSFFHSACELIYYFLPVHVPCVVTYNYLHAFIQLCQEPDSKFTTPAHLSLFCSFIQTMAGVEFEEAQEEVFIHKSECICKKCILYKSNKARQLILSHPCASFFVAAPALLDEMMSYV